MNKEKLKKGVKLLSGFSSGAVIGAALAMVPTPVGTVAQIVHFVGKACIQAAASSIVSREIEAQIEESIPE